MTMPNPSAPELLRQEILAAARQHQEDILQRANHEAEAIVGKAEQAADQFRVERLEAARAEAKRRTEAILATVPVEAGRMRSARIEEFLDAIRHRASAQLHRRTGFDFRATLTRLAAEALTQMAGDTFSLRLSAADHRALGKGVAQETQSRSGRPNLSLQLVVDSGLKEGEVLIEDQAGRQVWDLSLEARLNRCWPELRRQIATQAAMLEPNSS